VEVEVEVEKVDGLRKKSIAALVRTNRRCNKENKKQKGRDERQKRHGSDKPAEPDPITLFYRI